MINFHKLQAYATTTPYIKTIMITSLYLEGFKSFGKPVKIDFRDITLLYGENSSGKSTILQALQYAREVFCNGNLDCLKTEIGGDFVDLRGFDRFVNKREPNGTVTIGITTQVDLQLWAGPDEPDTPFKEIEFNNSKKLLDLIGWRLREDIRYWLNEIDEHRDGSDMDPSSLLLPINSTGRRFSQAAIFVSIAKNESITDQIFIQKLRVAYEKQSVVSFHAYFPEEEQDGSKLDSADHSKQYKVPRYQVTINTSHSMLPVSVINACKSISKGYGKKWDMLADLEIDVESLKKLENEFGMSLIENDSSETAVGCDAGETSDVGSSQASPVDSDDVLTDAGWLDRLREIASGNNLGYTASISDGISIPAILANPALTILYDCLMWERNSDVIKAKKTKSGDEIVDSQHEAIEENEYIFSRKLSKDDTEDLNALGLYASAFLISGLSTISDQLRQIQYIGPLRSHYRPYSKRTSKSELRCWSDGLGGWDYLESKPELLDAVNHWITDKRLFGFDCTVSSTSDLRLQFAEAIKYLSTSQADELRQIVSDMSDTDQVIIKSPDGYRLNSTDVGVGFSQVLPIIVAARGPQPACILLEQPELHIHVRLQAVLGDLLATGIEAGSDPEDRRQFIVETHSEALLLRLMRRIRETTKEIVNNGPRLLCDHVAIYHISKQDGNSIAKKIELDTYGNLTDEWPDDLFEMSFKERFGE